MSYRMVWTSSTDMGMEIQLLPSIPQSGIHPRRTWKLRRKPSKAKVPRHHNAISDVGATLEKFRLKGEGNPPGKVRQSTRLDTYQRQLGQGKERKPYLDNLPVKVGKILYSSDKLVSSRQSVIDWGNISRLPTTRPPKLAKG